jgi:hypothetical protein
MRRTLLIVALVIDPLVASAQPLPEEPPQPPPTPPTSPVQEPTPAPTPGLVPTAPPAPPPVEPAQPEAPKGEAKPEGGWFPENGFQLRSSDENWKLRLRLQSMIRAHVKVDGKAEFANPFMTLRPIIEGNLYKKWIRFWTSMELAANPVYLLDSYVEIQPIDEFGLRIGQQWTPLSRHEAIYGPAQLLFPEWDPVADYFWTGRDKGITAFGAFAEGKFDYSIGAYVGSPLRSFQPIRGNYQFIARLGLSPNGPVGSEFAYAEGKDEAKFAYAFGINGATSKLDQGTENFNPSTFKFEATPTGVTTVNHTASADFFLQSSHVVGLIEGYVRRTDPHGSGPDYTSVGGFAQLGVLVYKRDLDVAVRGSWVDVNVDQSHDDAWAIEIGTNYYVHAPWVVFKVRYGYGYQLSPTDQSATTSGGAPLITAPGPIHVFTGQINTVF